MSIQHADKRVYLYDTTLRDGAQTSEVNFSVEDKNTIAGWLDELGIAYIEGGWPGANQTDTDFFASPPALQAHFVAFGMTRRKGHSAENDAGLKTVMDAAEHVCLFGKT